MLAVSAGLAHAPQLIAFAAPAAFETNAPAAPSAFENAGVRQRIPAAHMVETMMRVPAPVKVRKIPAKTQRKPQPRLVAERQAAASRVLLTAWDADQAMPMAPAARRVTFAIFEFSSYSFGTAPVGRLIIVQL
jgi:hypothetical protein